MVDLNINLVAQMAGAGAGGAAGGAAGAAGQSLRGRAGGAMAAGLMGGAGGRTEMIGRGLGQISKQLPAAGILGDMAGAFKSGGIVGVGMAGVAGIMGFVKQIMESSKVFQGIAGSFFKIFGAMADVFLLPFLPLAMKGMQLLLRYLPNFSRWGQSAADGVDKIIATFKDKGFWGAIGHYLTEAWSFISEDVTKWVTDVLKPALAAAVMHLGGAIGNALKAAMSGKEQAGTLGPEGPTGKNEILQQKTGRWQINKGAWWTRLGERGGKSVFNAATAGLTGGRAKDWQWSPEELESQSGDVSEDVLAEISRLRTRRDSGGLGQTAANVREMGERGAFGTAPQSKALGGIVRGGPGQGVPTMLHGGELVIPRSNVGSLMGIRGGVAGVLTETNGQLQALEADINNYWMESKRDRQNPQSDFNKFDTEVLGGALPDTLNIVGGWYKGIGNTARNIANQTKGFGAGWTAAGIAAFKKYGVKPFDPKTDKEDEPRSGGGDGDGSGGGVGFLGDTDHWANAAKAAEIKYNTPAVNVDTERKTEEERFGGGPITADLAKGFNGVTDWNPLGASVIDNPDRVGVTAAERREEWEAVMNSFDENAFAITSRSAPNIQSANYQGGALEGVWDVVEASNQTAKQKQEMYEIIMSSGASDENATLARQTAMEKLATNIHSAQRIGGSGYYGDDDAGDQAGSVGFRTNVQVQADFEAAAATRKLQLQKLEQQRLATSLQLANETIYGPEGGVSSTGEFIHGGLLHRPDDDSQQAVQMRTLEHIEGLTEGQRADLAAAGITSITAPAPTAGPRPDAETMALAGMMIKQQERIDAYEPLIKAAWALANAGLEGGNTGIRRGTEAQRLIKERSQQEERLTRMHNQMGQDRLPYSLQEFQTRFPDEFAAGGIVPGDIGEPQMVMAHGGETVSPIGMTGGRQGHTSNRVMNISINNASSVRDILRDLNDMESMDDASFFNSVS